MDPRLLDVAQKGNVSELQKLHEEVPLLLERDSQAVYPETALHIATTGEKTEFVRELLKLVKLIKKEYYYATRLNKDGFSAIHIASRNGFVEIVRELLKISPELARLKSSDGRTCLHCAVEAGSVQIIEELVRICPDCIGDVTLKGETALHLAVKYNQFEAFKAMVDMNKKELLKAGDEDGNTVLHLAVGRKQSQTVKSLLVGDGTDQEAVCVNVTNKSGFTALDVSDVMHQMVGESTDSVTIRNLLLRAEALRASKLKEVERQSHEISLLSPCGCWKKLAKEVKHSPPETKIALLVVALLIATMTYQAILNPPAGFYTYHAGSCTYYSAGHGYYSDSYRNCNRGSRSFSLPKFLTFMIPNSIGFFVSLAVIILVMDGFPLKALLGIAVRCLAASYLLGLLFIGPTSGEVSLLGMAIIGIIVLVYLVLFVYWFAIKRWCKEYSYLWVTIIGIIALVELVCFVYWLN